MRVVVADDQTAVREGLQLLLGTIEGIEVVGVAADGEEALALCASAQPDIVLMDLRMPRLDGVEATRLVRERHPAIKVVVLTTYADDESIVGALRAGATGYLTKDAGRAGIVRALEAAASGQSVMDAAVQERLVGIAKLPAADGPLPDGLTAREGEVLSLVARGMSNSEVAARLFVSLATVKTHLHHLLAKTGCRDRPQLIAYAHERRLDR